MPATPSADKNKLYYGDNLAVLRDHIPANSVDLIYLDPPFNSRQDYNVLFAEKDGSRSASQITAIKDTGSGTSNPRPCTRTPSSAAVGAKLRRIFHRTIGYK